MPIDLPLVEAAALKLAARYETRYPTRARDLRHIAMDASCAADPDYPCANSLESVDEWLDGDDELCTEMQRMATASESTVPGRVA